MRTFQRSWDSDNGRFAPLSSGEDELVQAAFSERVWDFWRGLMFHLFSSKKKGNLLCRKDSPNCPRSCCPFLVHRVRTPPLRNLPRGAPWHRCASKIDGPCTGRPDNSSDSEPAHSEWDLGTAGGYFAGAWWNLRFRYSPTYRSSLGSLCKGLRLSHCD